MKIIELINVTKNFNNKKIFNNVNLTLESNKRYGFIGANGAGKTTLIALMSSLLLPDSGKIFISGFNTKTNGLNARKKLSFIFQECFLDEELNIEENLNLHAILLNLNKTERIKRIHYVLSLLNLQTERKKLIKTLSGGTKKRVEIARGLMNNPEIIFFDEPSLGLDPLMKKEIWKFIKSLKNKTIVITSNDLREAKYLCDKIFFVKNGEIKKIYSPKNFSDKTLEKIFLMELKK